MQRTDQKIIRNAGFTLIELLLVVFILGIIGSAAIPTGTSNQDQFKLNTAANEVANVIRFVRDEAVRTNETHGVSINFSSNRMRAFKVGPHPNPITGATLLYDPISKQILDKILPNSHGTEDVTVANTSAVFIFADGYISDEILFDQNGMPYWQGANGKFHMMQDSRISLDYNGLSIDITVKAGFGRVVIL